MSECDLHPALEPTRAEDRTMLAIGPLFFVGGLFIGLGLAAGLGAIFIVGLVLNAVLGFSEIIRDEILGPVGNNAYRYYANDIQKSGACLLAVINDLLNVTKLESGSVVLEDRPENPHDIMEQAIKLTRNATGDERAVAFILPGMLPTLTVYPRRPAQAVGNLLANALKSEGRLFTVFTPTGGLRLASDHGRDDYIEFALDTSGDEPKAIGRISRARGSRTLEDERPIKAGATPEALTEEDVLTFLIDALEPWLER